MQKHSIARAVAGARWNPRDGLIGSDQGIWLDPSDLSTMYVESGASPATLTPATLNGPVGRILDKSGRGNHAYSSTDAARPTLRIDANGCYYLLFNGTSSCLQTSTINFTNTDKMFVSTGVRKLSDGTYPVIAELYNAVNSASWNIHSSTSTSNTGFTSGLGTTPYAYWGATTQNNPAPSTRVVSLSLNSSAVTWSSAFSIVRINGVNANITDTSVGSNTPKSFSSNKIYIGARGSGGSPSLFFSGHVYQLIVCGRPTAVPIDQITRTEEFVNRKTKAY